uniref:Uncharacterized protein n=1 Tax=Oryza meridionalis TaxID=40149 RepID=A0A0E0CA64_9ORYZ
MLLPSLFPSCHQSFRLPHPLPVLLLSTAPDDAAADAVLAHLADRGYGRDLRLVAELASSARTPQSPSSRPAPQPAAARSGSASSRPHPPATAPPLLPSREGTSYEQAASLAAAGAVGHGDVRGGERERHEEHDLHGDELALALQPQPGPVGRRAEHHGRLGGDVAHQVERWSWESVPSPSPPPFAAGLDPMFVTAYTVHPDGRGSDFLELMAAGKMEERQSDEHGLAPPSDDRSTTDSDDGSITDPVDMTTSP